MEKIQKLQSMLFSFLVIGGIGLTGIIFFGNLEEYHAFAVFLFFVMLPKVFLEIFFLYEKMNKHGVWPSFFIAIFYYLAMSTISQLLFPDSEYWLWIARLIIVLVVYNWGAYLFQKKQQTIN